MRATVLEISPTPSARARSLTRVKRPTRRGGTPLRGSAFYWPKEAMTSHTPFPKRQSPGRRELHRPIGKRQPAISLSQLAALWFGDSKERGRLAEVHPLPTSLFIKVFPGVQARCDWRLQSSGRSCHS